MDGEGSHDGGQPNGGGHGNVYNMNVYARPFVSDTINMINHEPGVEFHTGPLRRIDYAEYMTQYLPIGLLPPRLLPIHPLDERAARGPPQNGYAPFFVHAIKEEIDHQTAENQTYSLPCHEATVHFDPDDQAATVTLTVPGLRENTPYVEEDDIVELRQLRFGNDGFVPWGMGMNPPTWTGYIYKARVSSVLRPRETLVLRVTGLTSHTSDAVLNPPWVHINSYPQWYAVLRFNVVFPVPAERYSFMSEVLPQVGSCLYEASKATSEALVMKMPVHYGEPAPAQRKAPTTTSANQYWFQSMLFPTEADCESQNNIGSAHDARSFYDRALNEQQRIAVENICSQNYGVLPYLISGPPGTGKTKTIIETALQLIRNVDNVNHILICAPSEPAADTLADRLRYHLKQSELLRLNRPSRTFGEVAGSLLPYCHIQDDTFALPALPRLLEYKVVVTSCRDASMLVSARLTNADLFAVESNTRSMIHPTNTTPPTTAKLHWNALLIDEAAQAMEPEALSALFVVHPPANAPTPVFTPIVVMAGDENQLTPRTVCPSTPLKRSLFARLFSRSVYANHPLSRRLAATIPGQAPTPSSLPPPTLSENQLPILRAPFTNLIQNYRSHAAILAIPSSLFYYDTLEASADPARTSKLLSWPGWPRHTVTSSTYPNPNVWPILLHDNPSPDDQEPISQGWHNPVEAELALQYASSIAQSSLTKQSEIVIMSPFKDQVKRIRHLARTKYNLGNLNIGPTEAYQGLEFDMVILCVTRSGSRRHARGYMTRRQFLEGDQRLGWGVIPPPLSSSQPNSTESVGAGSGQGQQGQGIANKLNVALTRARAGLIIIGDATFLREEDPVCWGAIISFYQRNGCIRRGSTIPTATGLHLPLTITGSGQVHTRSGSWADVARGLGKKTPNGNANGNGNVNGNGVGKTKEKEKEAVDGNVDVVRTKLEAMLLSGENNQALASASTDVTGVNNTHGNGGLTPGMIHN